MNKKSGLLGVSEMQVIAVVSKKATRKTKLAQCVPWTCSAIDWQNTLPLMLFH